MCTACTILDNYCPAFPGDEPIILRKHTCPRDDEFPTEQVQMIESATPDDAGPEVALHPYRLEFRRSVETYEQMIYARTIMEAMRIASETVERVAAWDGPPDSVHLEEVETI